jgi:outer membrane protein assembly factor BamB
MGGGPPSEVYQFVVLCLDRQTGNPLWQKTAREETPHEGHQPNNTFASASPITDGQVVLAYFGSRGLHCYDMEGNLKWSKDFGHMQTRMGFGEGASPALYGNTVVVCWDDEGDHDFIAALDKQTGKELWRTPRDEATGWSTPLVIDFQGKPQVVVNATGKVRSYDLATGKEIWSCAGQTANAIPSPVASADTVYVTSGFRGSALYAIRLGRTGDLKGTDAILWQHDKHTPYVPSPLLADDLVYVLAVNNNLLSCFDAKTGAEQFEGERLEALSEVYASPVAAKDRVYVLGRDGKCVVLRKGPKLEILATNKLADKTDASMALVDKEVFVRGRQNLYCIAGEAN